MVRRPVAASGPTAHRGAYLTTLGHGPGGADNNRSHNREADEEGHDEYPHWTQKDIYDRARMDVERVVAEIDAQLRAQATPERAVQEKAYLKSALEHYGTTVPAVRQVVKRVALQQLVMGHDELMALVAALWAEPVHERRTAAVEFLDMYAQLLEFDDLAVIERMLREARTWAFVDALAGSIVASLVDRDQRTGMVLDRWASDDDFWIRRSALLALLKGLRRGDGDFERFSRYADTMLDEKEFFIRKAIGWVLRETAKKRPQMVYEWLLPRANRLSGVTMREAVRWLSDEQRDAVLAAR